MPLTKKTKRRYDLPLHRDEGSFFLIVLIGLMGFLSIISLVFALFLNQMTGQWSQGLEKKATIEIPAYDTADKARPIVELEKIQDQIIEQLKTDPTIGSLTPVAPENVQDIIKSWLGNNDFIDDLPMPRILSVELNQRSLETLKNLTDQVQTIDPLSKIDFHQSWLADLKKLTGALQVTAFGIIAVIMFTTVCAIAGAIKSQIQIHRKDVELLHLMGAHDRYITRQFIRYASILSLYGNAGGLTLALIFMALTGFFFKAGAYDFLPHFSLSPTNLIFVLLIPASLSIIAALSAWQTVIKALHKTP